jgi:hypothetical protein
LTFDRRLSTSIVASSSTTGLNLSDCDITSWPVNNSVTENQTGRLTNQCVLQR